jgi:hypothetical protein
MKKYFKLFLSKSVCRLKLDLKIRTAYEGKRRLMKGFWLISSNDILKSPPNQNAGLKLLELARSWPWPVGGTEQRSHYLQLGCLL